MIKIEGTEVRQAAFQIEGLDGLSIEQGEQIAIVGDNAAGKSLLVGILTKAYPMKGGTVRYDFGGESAAMDYQKIKLISFRDSYGADDAEYYYQQRWNSNDVLGRKTVRDELSPSSEMERAAWYSLFGIDQLLDKQLLLLSSGEMRKFRLAKALSEMPRLLIMDNPFIGLDAPSREGLRKLLEAISLEGCVQLVLVLSRAEEIPSFVTHVLPLSDKTCLPKVSKAAFLAERQSPISQERIDKSLALLASFAADTPASSSSIVEMDDVCIRYGEKEILKNIHLHIRSGEKWALSGSNGSGKSTLLSLICADNPQSYACKITLFGRKRGSGESIWDIKKRIGYVSPEMQRSYQQNLPVVDIVASGLYDTLGLYMKISDEQRAVSLRWMEVFGIDHLAARDFLRLSSGEQRMVLLARAFVKSPELLILDEPLHGLDTHNRRLAIAIIEAYTAQPSKTAIIVSHYPEELPSTITHRLCLSAGVMSKG